VDTRITADTLTTAVPIMGDIHTVRMDTGIPLTDKAVTITTARAIRTTRTARFIAVTTDRLLRAYRNGTPALDIIAARLMA